MNEIGHGQMKAFLDVTQRTLLYLYARTQTFSENMLLLNLGFIGPCIFAHSNESSNHVGRGRAGRPDHDQQHCYHHVPTVNQRLLLQLIGSR